MADLKIKLGNLALKNPVMTASGTFGYGLEFADLMPLDGIGGIIVKLSPNVTNISEIARAVEAEGADSVSLINTLMGMAIDIEKRKPLLSINTGGLSGPAVKPVALRMVWQVAKAVKIPVVGLGGICNAKDAIEFLMAGATAIEIGTANFLDPTVSIKVRDGINDWLDRHGCKSVQEIIGVID